MYFTKPKKSTGALIFNQIIFVFVLLTALVGQVSAFPTPGFTVSGSHNGVGPEGNQ